ncbi:hypothetical protein DMC25_22375 [Caulobacter sp. D4A]|uniref:hypothetical protein n=1 Tax=unclassified Caulobacter TaxID=2648921 RepID=UPI000D73629E|nr:MULTISPECIES: hypothetical protein [unclassified Caulobacter]PXA78649.1 hypothetical protein DMC25_22375 [Caulobacter sp. D4A]PXA83671.1 hypothetical protein DMC18_24480 [Caulobacter sp. D5]
MLIASLAAAGALGLSWPSLPQAIPFPTEGMHRRAGYKVKTKAYHLKGWEMRIERDGFTGLTRCRLYAPSTVFQGRMTYARDVLGFHLGEDVDVGEAWYSIDDKPPVAWRDDFPTLASRREPLSTDNLFNPTGGVVLIPHDKLDGARTVTIRAGRDQTPRRFRLKGFERALAAARANGCGATDGEAGSDAFQRDALTP